jgi:rod shape-determining protein MreC
VTSGFGDRFPAGFPVGEVERVQRDRGATFATVYMRPYAALDRGREVLLVVPQQSVPATAVEQP